VREVFERFMPIPARACKQPVVWHVYEQQYERTRNNLGSNAGRWKGPSVSPLPGQSAQLTAAVAGLAATTDIKDAGAAGDGAERLPVEVVEPPDLVCYVREVICPLEVPIP
jgi:hypothetical protein